MDQGTAMTQIQRTEMAIPKWGSEVVAFIVMILILVIATLAAIIELLTLLQVIVPCIWLAIMGFFIWSAYRECGSVRQLLANFLGLFALRQFVESVPQASGAVEIRFGFKLFGHRFFYLTVPLDKIERIEWSTGQASDMAGRDMGGHIVEALHQGKGKVFRGFQNRCSLEVDRRRLTDRERLQTRLSEKCGNLNPIAPASEEPSKRL